MLLVSDQQTTEVNSHTHGCEALPFVGVLLGADELGLPVAFCVVLPSLLAVVTCLAPVVATVVVDASLFGVFAFGIRFGPKKNK